MIVRLSELQELLARLMGEAMQEQDEDPRVYFFDRYGARYEVGEVRLDWQPVSLVEAEDGTRHPVVEFLPPEYVESRYLVHPISGRILPWHEHEWVDRPYHDGATLRTCSVEDCPFSVIVPAGTEAVSA